MNMHSGVEQTMQVIDLWQSLPKYGSQNIPKRDDLSVSKLAPYIKNLFIGEVDYTKQQMIMRWSGSDFDRRMKLDYEHNYIDCIPNCRKPDFFELLKPVAAGKCGVKVHSTSSYLSGMTRCLEIIFMPIILTTSATNDHIGIFGSSIPLAREFDYTLALEGEEMKSSFADGGEWVDIGNGISDSQPYLERPDYL